MESVRMKGNARKSTYSGKPPASGKPRASIQEQLRLRQSLEPESNVNHVPVKSSPTTWKRSGWSLSARVRHSSREEQMEGLLTPMELNKDKEKVRNAEASNGDTRIGSGNAENLASGEKKSPDQRSLWSLFSAPKVQECSDENKSRVYGISNGTSRRQELTPHQAALTRDQSFRKQEEREPSEKTPTPSFNLLSKIKPFKTNASRNFFAQLGKKPDGADNQEKAAASEDKVITDLAKNTQNVATVPQTSRISTRTKDTSRKKPFDDKKIAGADLAGRQEKLPKRRPSLREQVTGHSSKKADVSVNRDATVTSDESKVSADELNIFQNISTGAHNWRLHCDDRAGDFSSTKPLVEDRIEDTDIGDGREQHPKRRLSLREQRTAHLSKRTNVTSDNTVVSVKAATDIRTDKHKISQDSTEAYNQSLPDRTTDRSRKNSSESSRTEGKEMVDNRMQHPKRRHSLREQVAAFSNKGRTSRSTKDTKDALGKAKLLVREDTDMNKKDSLQSPGNSKARTVSSDSAENGQGRQNQGRTSSVKEKVESGTVLLAKDAEISEKAGTDIQKQSETFPEQEETKTTVSADQAKKSVIAGPAIISPVSEEAKIKIPIKEKLESETASLENDADVLQKAGAEEQKQGRSSPVCEEAKNKAIPIEKQEEKSDISGSARLKQDRVSPCSKEMSEIASLKKQTEEPDKAAPAALQPGRVSSPLEDRTTKTSSVVEQTDDGNKSRTDGQKQDGDSPVSDDVMDESSIFAKQEEESNNPDLSKLNQGSISPVLDDVKKLTDLAKEDESDKSLSMPTLTLPVNIRYPRTTSNVSSEADEDECLFIDENARVDQSSENEVLDEDEDDESHVLRVWSLQSEEETSSDILNLSGSFSVDAESLLGLDADSSAGLDADVSQAVDDSFASAVIESLSSLDVSKTEDNAGGLERPDGNVDSDSLVSTSKEKSETTDTHLINMENRRRNSDDGPPVLQAQPNTHHLLKELDSLLECSTFQNETHVNVSPEASEEMPIIDTNEQRTSQEYESNAEPEPTRNIFSIFGGAKQPRPATNIVKLDLGNSTKQSPNSSYRSVLSKDSIVLSGSCSGERDSLKSEERHENSNVNNSSSDKSMESVSTTKSGIPAVSCNEIVENGPPTSSSDKSLETDPSTALSIQSSENVHLTPRKSLESGTPVSNSNSLITGLPAQSSDTLPPVAGSGVSSNEQDAGLADVPSSSLLSPSSRTLPFMDSSDGSIPILTSPDSRIPSLTLETDDEYESSLRSSQPPELCLEVTPSSMVDKEDNRKSPLPPVPEEEKMDDIAFLAFDSRDDLFSYSKSLKLKIQRKGTQAPKAPVKKVTYPVVKNVKMKRRRPTPLAAKIKTLEQDLLLSMESKGITEIVHPSLSRRGIALGIVKKNNLFVNVRSEELERTSHKRPKHKKRHRSRTEVGPLSGFRWQDKESSSVEILGSKLLGRYSSNSNADRASEQERIGKSSVVGLKHGPPLGKYTSTVHSSGVALTNTKKNKPKHSSSHQEWAICTDGPRATSEKPSLKLKFISKPKTSPTKVEQSPFALSTKPKESTVPLKSPTSHIPVNVQQLHVPSSSAASKSIALVVPKPVEEKPKPAVEKPPPSTRLPEEESLPFKPFEKPVASKKSAFVSDALEDLLQGEDINNKLKSLISPSTISVSNAKVVYKVPSRQSHTVKTLDMALKRLKPLNVSSPSFSEKIEGHPSSEKKKKKKKKKHKHKDRTKDKIREGYVFGSGPDDLVRKLPKLPFASYGKTFARPLFAREDPAPKRVRDNPKGFLAVRNVLSMSEKAPEKCQSDEVEVQPEKKIKQEPIENEGKLPAVINKSILSINNKVLNILESDKSLECKESLSEESHATSEKEVKKCPDYCRLGCMCSCLNDSRPVRERTVHCRKVDCMFDCVCNKNSMQIVTGTRNRRPPSFSQDMFFYDDSHKFWRTGAIDTPPADVKKPQLLDHLPASEKRTLVSSCARTRLFETDKPDRWLKWKRRQQGDPVQPRVEKKGSSDVGATPVASEDSKNTKTQGLPKKPNAATPMDSLQSTVPSTTGIHGPQTKVGLEQQKPPRKSQHFIKLSVPGDTKSQSDPASKMNNGPVFWAPSLPIVSNPGNAGGSQVMSTFIPVAKQYLLNGNLMNMVVLPNGNRVLIPAKSCPSYRVHTVVNQTATSNAPVVNASTANVNGAQSRTTQNSIAPTRPTTNTVVQSQTQPSVPVSANINQATGVHSGFQRPVLPIRYQITSSGIKVSPGVVGTSSQIATEGSSDYSHGTLNLVPQASQQIRQTTGSSEKCKPSTSVSQPVPKTQATSKPRPVQVAAQLHPSTASKVSGVIANPSNKNVDSQRSVQGATLLDSTKAETVARSDGNVQKTVNPQSTKKYAADSQCSVQGSTQVDSSTTESVERSSHNVQKESPRDVQKGRATKQKVQSHSEITSDEEEKECIPEITKEILEASGDKDFLLTKTFFLTVEGSETYVIVSFAPDCKWTKPLEFSIKREVTKFIQQKKSAGIVQSLEDMELELLSWDTRRYCIRLRLTAKSPVKQVAVEAKTSGGESENIQCDDPVSGFKLNQADQVHSCDIDAPNPPQEGNIKTQPKTVGLTATTATAARIPPDSNISKRASSPDHSQEDPVTKPKNQFVSPKGKPVDSNPSKLKTAVFTPESRSETSKKLSSSLPEFEKLSEIVKRNSAENDDAGLNLPKKISKSAIEWLHDPKVVKSSELQNYCGMRGPWFTKEKEGVKIVLQKNTPQKAPYQSTASLQRSLSKRPSSSVLIISPKKSRTSEDSTVHSLEESDPISHDERSLTDSENEIIGIENTGKLDTPEESPQKSRKEVSNDGKVISRSENEGKASDSKDNKDQCYLDTATGLLVDKDHASSSAKQSDDDSNVNCSKESQVNDKMTFARQSDQHSSSEGSQMTYASSQLSDARRQDGVEVEKETNKDNEGCLDIEHFARFSEEDAYGSIDFDDDVSHSFDLPTFYDDDDDSSSVASLKIDESIIDVPNSDLEKSKASSKDEDKNSSDDVTRPLSNNKLDSRTADSVSRKEATPVKHTNVIPKKSPLLNIKFVATSNENCAPPICLSPLSEVPTEYSQDRSVTPLRSPTPIDSNDPSESALSDTEVLPENLEERQQSPVETKDQKEADLSVYKKCQEKSVSPVSSKDQSDDAVPATESIPKNSEDTLQTLVTSNVTSEAVLSNKEKSQECLPSTIKSNDQTADALSAEALSEENGFSSLAKLGKVSDLYSKENLQDIQAPPTPVKSDDCSEVTCSDKISHDNLPTPSESRDRLKTDVSPTDNQIRSPIPVTSNDQAEMALTCTEATTIRSPTPVTSDDRLESTVTYTENSALKSPAPASKDQSEMARTSVESSNPSQSAQSDMEVDVVNTDDDDEIDVETVLGPTVIPTSHLLNPYSSLRDITSRLSSALKKEEEQKVSVPKKINQGIIPKKKTPKPSSVKIPLIQNIHQNSSNIKNKSAGQSSSLSTHLKKKKKKEKTKRKSPLCPSKQWDSPQFRVVYGESSPSQEEDEGLTRLKNHNFLERKRREDLRKSFIKLSNVIVPTTDERMPPKIMILKKATEKIMELCLMEEKLVKEKKHLKEHQRRLVYVHSNLLHHARCSGQVTFPKGSRLAESMDKIRLGMGKHFSTSPQDEDAEDSSVLPRNKGEKRTADHLTKIDASAYPLLKKKKKKTKSEGLDLMQKKSTVSSKTASGLSFKSKKVPRIYSMDEIVKSAIETEKKILEKKISKRPLDLSSWSDSQNVRKESPHVFRGDESSDDEESLPIECYVSSSDELEEQDDAEFGAYEDEEQYSDDGFIPASDDEDTASINKVERSSDESKGDRSDRETADIGLLDSFQPVKVLPGSCKVTQRSLSPRSKKVISVESTDSDDDVLVLDEARSSGKLKKKHRTKLGSHSERRKSIPYTGALKSPRADQSSGIVHSIPSEVSSGTESTSSRTAVRTKLTEKMTGEKQSKAPLVNVIDEIMNRLRGDTSAESSAGEEKASEVTGPVTAQHDVSYSRSETQKKQSALGKFLAPAGTPIDIKAKGKDQAATTLNTKKPDFLAKETSTGAVGQSSVVQNKTPSTSTKTMDGLERIETSVSVGVTPGNAQPKASNAVPTFMDKAVNQGYVSKPASSSSIQSQQKLDSPTAFKHKKDEQQDISHYSDPKSTDEVEEPKSMNPSRATVPSRIQSEKEKSSDSSLKFKMEEMMKRGLGKFDEISDDSDWDSSDEVEQEVATSTSYTKNTKIIFNVRKNNPVTTQKNSTAPSTAKDFQSDTNDAESMSITSVQQKSSDLKMEGPVAYTSQIRSVLRRVSQDLEDEQEQDSLMSVPNDTTEQDPHMSVPNDTTEQDPPVSLMKDTTEQDPPVSLLKDTTALQKKGALADLISSMKTRVGNDEGSDVSEESESEDEAESDDDEASDDDDGSNDEETSEDEGKDEKEDVTEDVITSNDGRNEKQGAICSDAADIDKCITDHSEASEHKSDEIKKLDSLISTSSTGLSTAEVQNKDSSENLHSNPLGKMTDPSNSAQEKDQRIEKLDQHSLDDSPGMSFSPSELQVGFSADEDMDDDAACLSYAAMGNDEDNEALFDAEDHDSPFSPLSLDMNITSDDDVITLDDKPESRNAQPPDASPSVAGTSTKDTKPRQRETSPRAEQSPGHQKPSASSTQDLTLDEAISFLNIEKNSDGTVNVFLKGDYDDEMLDELFKKPGVMEYIMKTVAKKS